MSSADSSPALTSPPPVRSRFSVLIRRRSTWAITALSALLVWQWLDTRNRVDELIGRIANETTLSQESRSLAKQGQESLEAVQARVAVLEAKIAEAQSQQLALEALYQEMSRSRDERLLAEVEQSLTIAAQQLQLAGNVEAALIALQSTDARLARVAQPQLMPLRKLISRDITRLKSLPNADVTGIAVKLEGLVASIDSLPLAFEQRPAVAKGEAKKAGDGWWVTLGNELWGEFRQLIRIERLDRNDPALVSPAQAVFLRENLKLRLVNARLALIARDGHSFREDLRQADDWLGRYFDGHAKPVQAADATVKSLVALDIARDLPNLDETLTAVRNFKLARDKR